MKFVLSKSLKIAYILCLTCWFQSLGFPLLSGLLG